MPKKPFIVKIELEVAIFAEDEKSIRYHPELNQAVRDAIRHPGNCISSITPLNRIPNGWDEHCLIYGADGDVSIGEALKQLEG
jgi:hypothetical protein